jgi:hypothetical protein
MNIVKLIKNYRIRKHDKQKQDFDCVVRDIMSFFNKPCHEYTEQQNKDRELFIQSLTQEERDKKWRKRLENHYIPYDFEPHLFIDNQGDLCLPNYYLGGEIHGDNITDLGSSNFFRAARLVLKNISFFTEDELNELYLATLRREARIVQ